MTPARRAALPGPEAGGDAYRDLVRQMGTDGWLGVGWPKEYGGQGRTPAEQFVFYDEAQRAGVPMPLVTLNTVGPTLMRFGSDEQKAYFLPRILAGELHFAIGYTEPAAGTDLASLRTRAVRDGDQYVVNGQKVFTTGGNDADWVWLACRTDPDAPKHKGISILLVDTEPAGLQALADPPARWRLHERHVLRGRARAGVVARRQGERGLEDDHEPAQPRAGRARACGHDRPAPPGRPARGRRRRASPTAGASSTGSGCGSRWRACTPTSTRSSSPTGRSRRRSPTAS